MTDIIRDIGSHVYLVGHSYGAHCALPAAAANPARVRRLVLYEPAWPHVITPDAMLAIETLATAGAWDQFAFSFFANTLHVPNAELALVRASELWAAILADAPATLGDLRALHAYRFDAPRFSRLDVPTLLQIGSESPRNLYVTDALAAVLPEAWIDTFDGQAHEAMTTAPELYARATMQFLLRKAPHAIAGARSAASRL